MPSPRRPAWAGRRGAGSAARTAQDLPALVQVQGRDLAVRTALEHDLDAEGGGLEAVLAGGIERELALPRGLREQLAVAGAHGQREARHQRVLAGIARKLGLRKPG